MKKPTNRAASTGRGNSYTPPELTEIRIRVEQGFANSYDTEDMEVQPEEEW